MAVPSPPTSDPGDDLRSGAQAFGNRQQVFEHYLADRLGVDHSGLMVMNLLLTQGPTTPTELAGRLGISTAAMSLVLNRLEAAGHTRRDRHPSDGRKLVVTALPESGARAMSLVQPVIDGIDRIAAEMTPAERRTVLDFFRRLIEVYDAAVQPAKSPDPSSGLSARSD